MTAACCTLGRHFEHSDCKRLVLHRRTSCSAVGSIACPRPHPAAHPEPNLPSLSTCFVTQADQLLGRMRGGPWRRPGGGPGCLGGRSQGGRRAVRRQLGGVHRFRAAAGAHQGGTDAVQAVLQVGLGGGRRGAAVLTAVPLAGSSAGLGCTPACHARAPPAACEMPACFTCSAIFTGVPRCACSLGCQAGLPSAAVTLVPLSPLFPAAQPSAGGGRAGADLRRLAAL